MPWLLLLFFGSGCAALIYEIVWLQLLQLVIGLTTISLGVLLGTFMGGMCLGSWILPRLISARRHPLRVYACLELGIGIMGIALLWAMPSVERIYTSHGGLGMSGMAFRGVTAAICLLPPTMLMGATLPAMSRWVETTPQGVSWLGFFYGGNLAGAVFGCLLAGFYLLRVHDMAWATYVAAAINGVVALMGFALAARAPYRAAESFSGSERVSGSLTPSASGGGRESKPFHSPAWPVYLTIALSGLAALGAEVVWTRLLSLTLGGTVYTFSIILAVFLLGLGIGSSLGSLWARATDQPRRALGWCQLLLIASVGWAAYAIAYSLPYWPVNPSLSSSPWFTFQLDLVRCLWAILPAACLWGASFPLALAGAAARGQDPGRLVGGVYAANTVGAIVGALGFSLIIIPFAGTHLAQRLLIGLSAVATIIMMSSLRSKWVNGGLGMAAALGLAALLIWRVGPAPWGLITYGRFMATFGDRLAPGVRQEKDVPPEGGSPDIFATFVGEGLNGSVAVTKWSSGVRNFHSAGKVQASNDPHDMRLQRMLGHISALAHENPESVLVVACGAGVTAGSFVVHPEVKRIVICDIEPLVPKFVAPMFDVENYGVVRDPRTEVVFDDGRHFIRTAREKFDVITSDPIDPWVKGCAALNTVEYYEMCKAHLKPGGVMSLWIPLYESNRETVKSVIATFFKVFPNGILWSNDADGSGYDAVLFGQVEPTRLDLDQLQSRLDRPDHARVKESLAQVGFSSVLDLVETFAGQASDLQDWTRGAQLNTDRNLRLQYLAGMWLNSSVESAILSDIARHYRFPDNLFLGSEATKQRLKARPRATGGQRLETRPRGTILGALPSADHFTGTTSAKPTSIY